MVSVQQSGQNPFTWIADNLSFPEECPEISGPCFIIIEDRFLNLCYVDLHTAEVTIGAFYETERPKKKLSDESIPNFFSLINHMMKNENEFDWEKLEEFFSSTVPVM